MGIVIRAVGEARLGQRVKVTGHDSREHCPFLSQVEVPLPVSPVVNSFCDLKFQEQGDLLGEGGQRTGQGAEARAPAGAAHVCVCVWGDLLPVHTCLYTRTGNLNFLLCQGEVPEGCGLHLVKPVQQAGREEEGGEVTTGAEVCALEVC